MATRSLALTSPQPATRSAELLRQALVRWGEIFGREITPALISIWREHFGGMPPESLRPVLARVERESKFFPTPGQLRELLEEKEQQRDTHGAAVAWDEFLAFVRRHGSDAFQYPLSTGGELRFPNELPGRTMATLGRMGGYARVAAVLESGGRDDVHWVRKEFVELYEYASQTHDLLAPSREEARRLLSQVQQEAKKQLGANKAHPENRKATGGPKVD